MSVVVNEWEVVPERDRSRERELPRPPEASAPPPSLALELEKTMRLLRERAARLEAD